jgi:hypothetical protein
LKTWAIDIIALGAAIAGTVKWLAVGHHCKVSSETV